MKLKSTRYSLFIYIAILALVAGLYFLIKSNSEKTVQVEEEPITQVEKEKPVPKLIDESMLEERSSNQPDKYTTIKVSYPQFKNVSAEFNAKIESVVVEKIDESKKNAEDSWKARYENSLPGDNIAEFPVEDEKFYLNISSKAIQANSNYISFILSISGYTGGAHGYENLISFNYDVVNKKEIALADLFPSDQDYLKNISEFSRKDLEAQFRKTLSIKTKEDEANFKDSIIWMLVEGTKPTAENFSVFTFTKEAVTFYFNQYQVAPYAMGGSLVEMPRK